VILDGAASVTAAAKVTVLLYSRERDQRVELTRRREFKSTIGNWKSAMSSRSRRSRPTFAGRHLSWRRHKTPEDFVDGFFAGRIAHIVDLSPCPDQSFDDGNVIWSRLIEC
jgi:hypothetical protein